MSDSRWLRSENQGGGLRENVHFLDSDEEEENGEREEGREGCQSNWVRDKSGGKIRDEV